VQGPPPVETSEALCPSQSRRSFTRYVRRFPEIVGYSLVQEGVCSAKINIEAARRERGEVNE
jgi:hypothetical protein